MAFLRFLDPAGSSPPASEKVSDMFSLAFRLARRVLEGLSSVKSMEDRGVNALGMELDGDEN